MTLADKLMIKAEFTEDENKKNRIYKLVSKAIIREKEHNLKKRKFRNQK